MKKYFLFGLWVGALATGLAWAADSGDPKIDQDVHQLKKDYQKQVDKDLKEIGAKIDHLKHQSVREGDKLQGDLNSQVKKLQVQKAGVDRKFKDLQRSTGDAWKDMRQGLDDAVADLRRSVDEATEQFKKDK